VIIVSYEEVAKGNTRIAGYLMASRTITKAGFI
jgi:hypothetical protein